MSLPALHPSSRSSPGLPASLWSLFFSSPLDPARRMLPLVKEDISSLVSSCLYRLFNFSRFLRDNKHKKQGAIRRIVVRYLRNALKIFLECSLAREMILPQADKRSSPLSRDVDSFLLARFKNLSEARSSVGSSFLISGRQ